VEKQPLHLKVQSGSKETLVSTLGNMIRDNFSEDSDLVLMVSCSKSSGEYRASFDLGGPEPVVT
jgi:predicted nucleotidyltransferase